MKKVFENFDPDVKAKIYMTDGICFEYCLQ